MIEIVDRSRHHDEVARCVEIVEHEPGDRARVVYVDVVVYDDQHARQHHHVPEPQSAFMTFFACPGYDFFIETMHKLWKPPSTGKL